MTTVNYDRCNDNLGIIGGAGHGLIGAGVRGVGVARTALLPDPAHGAHGPPWRDLETARLRCLRASTGYIYLRALDYFMTVKCRSYMTFDYINFRIEKNEILVNV